MSHIDELLTKLSTVMTSKLDTNISEFERRTLEPSPGDVFDLYLSAKKAERYYYVSHDYIIPLHRLIRGELEEFSGYRETGVDIVAWQDIVESVDYCEYPDEAYLEIVSTSLSTPARTTNIINSLSDWASRSPNRQEAVFILNIIEKIRCL